MSSDLYLVVFLFPIAWVTMCRMKSTVLLLACLLSTSSATDASTLQVDLGYSVYEGIANTTLSLNIWKGFVPHSRPENNN
jgi:hypothetical protein